MKKYLLFVVSVAAAACAMAQDLPLQFLGSMMLTGGGDKLYSGQYDNNNTYDITAGGTYALNVGANYSVTPLFDLQISLGYQTSTTTATNGNIDFSRYPLEMIGFYQFNNQFRLGAGVRSALGAKTSSSGVAATLGSKDFKPSVGSILELQYLISQNDATKEKSAFTVRYVAESFTEKTSNLKVKGNHVGLGFVFYR